MLAHSCEKRRRVLARGDRDATLGYLAYVRTMETWRKPTPTHESFERSTLYLAFVKFGRKMLDIEAVEPMRFLDFLLAREVPIDRWCDVTTYEIYLRELNKIETPDAASIRTVNLMQSWANETPARKWFNFFREIEPTRAVRWIMSGRISPWALYTAPSAESLLMRLSDEQIALVQPTLDPEFWNARLDKHPEDVERLRVIFAEFGA